jgi:hypothetical protein
MKSNDFRILETIENRKKLDVTLVAVASNMISETLKALRKCINLMEFSKVKFITHELPDNLPSDIEYVECPKLTYIDNMEYVFKELGQHIDTTHCLLIQHDSWILRPQMWNDDWLQYDYIAPPWSTHACMKLPTGDYVRVGCGGFALRSKKFMDIPKKYDLPLVEYIGYPCNQWAEDWNSCFYYRDLFLKLGIKYAPQSAATEFGQEVDMDENVGIYPFGFHRYIH